ncbi:molybdate transport system ATP-binding protein [Desulfobaculum xiamenense]|uniref:Molybdate transport system ATP-binding protein n=1 Tax=Desulfobaculum xiamenense TaxID=995050 RepID=A0A846QH71_9BACT|nr:ATP-binding cassette domain-containing protein [Desulfobaculum xiamenense]NJB66470.1 molybdate transport system ATP-binding protein [Desulfobaculum xiamenense]
MTLRVDITKKLANFTLDIAFECAPGTLTAVVGPSGAGKSTLIRTIAGLERPDSGRITLGDATWNDSGQGLFVPPQKRGLGMVFQDYTLFPHLTVAGNVAFAARDRACVPDLLERFGITHLASRRPSSISGGERQRAAFCQALARCPVMLLLDEPFSALDVATRNALRVELLRLKDDLGIPMVHVTHDLEEAYQLADDILAVEAGHASPEWLERQGMGRPRSNGGARSVAPADDGPALRATGTF